MKAREYLAQKKIEPALRNLVKERLSLAEIEKLAKLAGDLALLVAPKRRTEAAGLTGRKLLEWLAADGGNLRRPIIVTGGKIALGFTAETRAELEKIL